MSVTNCEIKENNYSSELEIIVRNSSELQRSPVKFALDKSELKSSSAILATLDQLPTLANYQVISVRIKVGSVGDVVSVPSHDKKLDKQECVVADATGSCKVVLWNDNLHIFQVGSSYQLDGVYVCQYQGKKYLSLARENFHMSDIDDIEVNAPDTPVSITRSLTDCTIVGVKSLDSFPACYSCHSKVLPTTHILGACSRCGITQILEKCQESHTARVDISSEESVTTVTIFSPLLEEICNENVSHETLLMLKPFSITLSDSNVATSITNI